MNPDVEVLASDPEIKPLVEVNYLRFGQRVEHEQEIERVERDLNDPVVRRQLQNPGRLKQQNDERKRNLATQSPPVLSPSQRDKVAKLNSVALSDAIEGMVSTEEMRHRPPGAVDRHMAWEAGKTRSVMLWKSTQILLHPQSTEQDLCNIERFRPSVPTRSLFTDGLINQPFALSPAAKENYDEIDWTSPEVAANIQRLVDEGKIRINLNANRPMRAPKDGGKVYECKHESCHGRTFSGQFAKANFARHEKSHQEIKV